MFFLADAILGKNVISEKTTRILDRDERLKLELEVTDVKAPAARLCSRRFDSTFGVH